LGELRKICWDLGGFKEYLLGLGGEDLRKVYWDLGGLKENLLGLG